MAEALYLKDARTIIDEPGAGLVWRFGPDTVGQTRKRLARGDLNIRAGFFDELAGHIVGEPEWDHASMDRSDWTLTTDANWFATEVEPWLLSTGAYAAALLHAADADWSAYRAGFSWGQGFFLRLITYGGDVGSGPVIAHFGGAWRLTLETDGMATLDESIGGDWVQCARFRWMSTPLYAPTEHALWCYSVGTKLVIRNTSRDSLGQVFGVVWQDDSGATDPATGRQHALRPGPWYVTGSGFTCLSMVPQTWKTQQTVVSHRLTPVGLKGSSKAMARYLDGLSPFGGVAATATVWDDEGDVWASGSDPDGNQTAMQWQVAWTSTADDTYALAGAAFVVPQTTESDGSSGVNVLGVAGVALQNIVVTRDGDLTRESLRATLFTTGSFAAYVRPNMPVRYINGAGVTWFRGLTDEATWVVAKDAATQLGYLNLGAQGLWRRFRETKWPGGRPFDGLLLTDCLAAVCDAAGIGSAAREIATWDFVLPSPPAGEPPALAYRPGVSLDDILRDLAEKWYGLDWWQFFRLSDGKFVFEARSAGASQATFYDTNAAAASASVPGQVILDGSYEETLDDSEMANVICVTGQTPLGEPLQAIAVDWDSIQDKTASNYVGEPWRRDYYDASLQTQAAVSLVCRRLFERYRYPRVHVRWRSIRVNVFPGQVVTLSGANHGQSVWLDSVSMERASAGEAAEAGGRASYAGTVV